MSPSKVDANVAGTTERPSRWVVAGLVGVIAVVVAYFVAGMPGMDHGGEMPSRSSAMDMGLDVREFRSRMLDPDATVINVHVPDEGEIPGTDLTIAYDRIASDTGLPADKETAILLYCKTGRMSAEAAETLMAAGYADVSYLDGGMDAWQRAGLTIVNVNA